METKEEVKKQLVDYLKSLGVYYEYKYNVMNNQIVNPKDFDEEVDRLCETELFSPGIACWGAFMFAYTENKFDWITIAKEWERSRKQKIKITW